MAAIGPDGSPEQPGTVQTKWFHGALTRSSQLSIANNLGAWRTPQKAINEGQINLKTNGEGYKDFIPIENICMSIKNIISRDIDAGIYNLATGESIKVIDFVNKIKSLVEERTGSKIILNINKDDAVCIKKYIYDNSKLTNILGQNKINHQDEIDRLIKFCITNFD